VTCENWIDANKKRTKKVKNAVLSVNKAAFLERKIAEANEMILLSVLPPPFFTISHPNIINVRSGSQDQFRIDMASDLVETIGEKQGR
jgi:hypothetical protein